MASGLRNLLVRIGADASQMRTEMRSAQNTLSGFQSGIKGIVGKIGATLAAVGIGAIVKDATSAAMAVEGQTVLINRLLGDSAKSFLDWAETGAMAFGISKRNAISYGSIFMSQLKNISTGTDDLKNKTEQLLEITSVMASQSQYDLNTVMEKVSSGLRGETDAIEDLGVQVTATTLQSTNAFKVFGQGAKSWDSITSDTVKKQIMYYGILEQATALYGNTLADTTATKMMIFRAELQNVQLALGAAFLPILNVVLPVLSAFASRLNKAIQGVATFFSVLFGHKKKVKDVTKTFDTQTKKTNKQTTSVGKLGDTFTKTGKKVKKAVDTMKSTLAGFDALNILSTAVASSPDPGTGTGGGGGVDPGGDPGGGVPEGSDPPDNGSKWEEWANKIKKVLSDLKPQWDNLKQGALDFWQGLVDIWNTPFIQNMVKGIIKTSWDLLKTAIDLVGNSLSIIGDLFSIIADILNGDWGKAWKDTKKLVTDVYDLFGDFIVDIVGGDIGKKLSDQFTTFKDTWANITADVEQFAKDVFSGKVTENLKAGFTKWWDSLKTIDVKKWFTDNVVPKINSAFDGMKDLGNRIWENVKYAFTTGKVGDITSWFYNNVGLKIKSGFNGSVYGLEVWSNIKKGVTDIGSDIKSWIYNNVGMKIKSGFSGSGYGGEVWYNVKSGIWNVQKDIKSWIYNNVGSKIKSGFSGSGYGSEVWANIKKGITNIGGKNITSWFSTNVSTPIKKAFSSITSGLGGSITAGFKTVYNKAVGFINSMIDAVNKMVKKLNNIPGVSGIPTISKIPKLAKGGITTGSTIANIGEAGREAVLPLENNTGWMKDLASQLSQHMGGGGGDIIIQIGGTQLGRIAMNEINKMQRQSGKPVFKL